MVKQWNIGDRIENRWEIFDIKYGGMGIVYCVWDKFLAGFPVALKTFQDQYLFNAKIVDLFVHEAALWIRLMSHKNIVTAYLVEQIKGRPYLMMEYVEGEPLRSLIENRKLDLFKVLDLSIQCCTGMIYVSQKEMLDNQKGMLHRDIKPENILINKEGIAKITDFGLAKTLQVHLSESSMTKQAESLAAIQMSGLVGTIPYMSPEQFTSETKLDVRSDIFSFGAVMYEMITGRRPFEGKSLSDYRNQISQIIPKEPSYFNSTIPISLSNIVMRSLSKQPSDRFSSFMDLRSELVSCCDQVTLGNYPLEKLEISVSYSATDPCLLLIRAISETKIQNYAEAISLFQEVVKLDPNSWNAWNNMGLCHMPLGQHEDAIFCFENALACAMDYDSKAHSLINKGSALMNLNRHESAIEYFAQALEIAPKCKDKSIIKASALLNKGNALSALRKFEDALDDYNKAESAYREVDLSSALYPAGLMITDIEEYKLWYNRGRTLRLMGMIKEAVRYQQKAIEINPHCSPAWAELGFINYMLKDYNNALDYFRRAVEINRRFKFRLLAIDEIMDLYGQTDILESQGDYSKALITYDILTLIKPENSSFWTARGICLNNLRQHNESLNSYDKAISLNPKDYQPWLNKGVELFELGRFHESLECIQEVLTLEPQHKNAQTLKQMCLEAIQKQ